MAGAPIVYWDSDPMAPWMWPQSDEALAILVMQVEGIDVESIAISGTMLTRVNYQGYRVREQVEQLHKEGLIQLVSINSRDDKSFEEIRAVAHEVILRAFNGQPVHRRNNRGER